MAAINVKADPISDGFLAAVGSTSDEPKDFMPVLHMHDAAVLTAQIASHVYL